MRFPGPCRLRRSCQIQIDCVYIWPLTSNNGDPTAKRYSTALKNALQVWWHRHLLLNTFTCGEASDKFIINLCLKRCVVNFSLAKLFYLRRKVPHRYSSCLFLSFLIFCDFLKEGLGSQNKHGIICGLGYKFILNINWGIWKPYWPQKCSKNPYESPKILHFHHVCHRYIRFGPFD